MSHRITRRSVLCGGLALPVAAIVARTGVASPASAVGASSVNAPFELPGYSEPAFPDRTFSITDFGARDGGKIKNTDAIADAIAACVAAGGGRVLIPAGVWLSGPIHLRSNVNLHMADGAELRFSDKFADYLPVVYMQRGGVRCYNYSPLIYARDCTNIAVTGAGTLNGQGQAWWPWKTRQPGMTRLFQMGADQVPVEQRVFGTEADGVRPCFIQPIDCTNVLFEGFTVVNGPSWNIHPVTCENVTVRGVRITTLGPNNDGIDPDGCRNVVIEDCFLDTGDDCICLKSGRNEDGWAVGKPCENVIVRRCRTRRGHGGIVLGSEMSAGIRNVLVHDCQFEGTARGIRLKSRPGRGGALENLWFRDIVMDGVGSAIHMTLRYAGDGSDRDRLPMFRNIHISNISCEKARVAVEMFGLPDADAISDVTMEDVAIRCQTGLRAEHVRNVCLTRLKLEADQSPTMRLLNCRDVTVEQSRCAEGTEVFVQVNGADSTAIRVYGGRQSGAARGVMLGKDVLPDAVTTDPEVQPAPPTKTTGYPIRKEQ